MDDLPSLDAQVYQNLMFLKKYDGNVEDLALTFSLESDGKTTSQSICNLLEFGQTKTVELIKGGKDIPVTNQNRIQYIYLVANYKLNTQIALQSSAFLRGLSDILQAEWLRIFDQV